MKINLKFKESEIGEVDKTVVDQNGNVIAKFIRNLNLKGFKIFPLFGENKKEFETDLSIEGTSELRNRLRGQGHDVNF